MKKLVLVFGNPHFPGDNAALKVSEKLPEKDFEIKFIERPEEILNYAGKRKTYILDTVKNLKKVTAFENTSNLKTKHSITPHDLDLGFYLKLLKEVKGKKPPNLKIIGIPMQEDIKKLTAEARKKMKTNSF